MTLETGTTSFLDRFALTRRLEENLVPLLEERGFKIAEYGHPTILGHDGSMLAKIKQFSNKKSEAALMVKFSPDFLCLSPRTGDAPFFMDAKTSITPVFFSKHIDRIRAASGITDLRREDIGEIEREAWDNYHKHYPADRVMVCFAAPYHPRLLVADWVPNIRELFRFVIDTNVDAGGSGTPHVNIHLGDMRTLDQFVFQEFGETVDPTLVAALYDFIKKWHLNKPAGRVNWKQFNNVVRVLQATCPWLETRHDPPGPQTTLFDGPKPDPTGTAVPKRSTRIPLRPSQRKPQEGARVPTVKRNGRKIVVSRTPRSS